MLGQGTSESDSIAGHRRLERARPQSLFYKEMNYYSESLNQQFAGAAALHRVGHRTGTGSGTMKYAPASRPHRASGYRNRPHARLRIEPIRNHHDRRGLYSAATTAAGRGFICDDSMKSVMRGTISERKRDPLNTP